MADLVFDTSVLAGLLQQYFEADVLRRGFFVPDDKLSVNLVRQLNRIIKYHSDTLYDHDSSPGLVIASVLAFIEVARKFDVLSGGKYSIAQFAAFIASPPDWFRISPLDDDILSYLNELPIIIREKDGEPLELADAVHVATALSREKFYVVTTDKRIKSLGILNNNVIS